MPQNPCVN